MLYFLLLMMSVFRVYGCVVTRILHDFWTSWAILFRRQPSPRGRVCFFFPFPNAPHGLPLFFADPLDVTISVGTLNQLEKIQLSSSTYGIILGNREN